MTIQIKICGVRDEAAMDAAAEAGATHIGLVHYEPSPRHVTLDRAAKLRMRAPSSLKVVLLLVNQEAKPTALAIEAVQPDVVQFHGSESAEWLNVVKDNAPIEVWKARGLKNADTLERAKAYEGAADMLLFDAPAQKHIGALPGGNGARFDWSLLEGYDGALPYGLAGGLDAGNVAQAIRETDAVLVDTSSGTESAPGVKDLDKIRAFCEAARSA